MKEQHIIYFTTDNKSGWKCVAQKLQRNNSELYDIVIHYSEQYNLQSLPFVEKVYCYLYDITTRPICECGGDVKFLNLTLGYQKFCSRNCSNKSEQTKLALKESLQSQYGVDHFTKIKGVEEKRKNTNMKKYGVENPFQIVEIQNQIIDTNIKRYGFPSPIQNSEIKHQIELTNMKKYGVSHHWKNSSIREKIKQTNLERYGVENPFSSIDIQSNIINTNLLKFGKVNAFQVKEIQKLKEQTDIIKYGVSHHWKNLNIREKIKQTNLERYGVEFPMNNEDVRKKFHKNFKGGTSKSEIVLGERLNIQTKFFFMGKEFDFKHNHLLIELDGGFWHADKIEHLTITQINNVINDWEKENLVANSEYTLVRVYEKLVNQINTLDDLINLSYIKDYTFNNDTVLMCGDYIKKHFKKIRKYHHIIAKFLKTFNITYDEGKLKNILGFNGKKFIGDLTINAIT